MADVNTQIYQPLQAPQQQPMTPLSVLQMIGQINTNRLFDQEYSARQNIGQAYHDNTLPGGNINTPGLRTQIGQTGGFRAGEGLQQATSNSEADTRLKGVYQQTLHSIFGHNATEKDISDQKIAESMAAASRQGVPGPMIQDYVRSLPRGDTKQGQAARRDWAVTR